MSENITIAFMGRYDAKKATEKVALVAGVLQPLLTLPQVLTIFSNQSARDVSLVTWLGYLIVGLPFLFYGITHKLRPIIVTQIIYIVMQSTVVIGVLIYG